MVLALKVLIGGTIRHKVKNHAYVLTITSISGLIKIIGLINGYLRTPKISRFNDMIRWINQSTGSTISTHGVDTSDLSHNAWLSGFVEADGSFDIRVSLANAGALKNRVSARLRLEQRMTDPNTHVSYEDIMSSIATALGITLSMSIHNGVQYYMLNASSTNSRALITSYFAQFPLFSSKHLNYLDWLVCNELINRGEHVTEKGRAQALLLKSGMNSKRTYFN